MIRAIRIRGAFCPPFRHWRWRPESFPIFRQCRRIYWIRRPEMLSQQEIRMRWPSIMHRCRPMFRVSGTHYAATWLLDERAPKITPPIALRERKQKMDTEMMVELHHVKEYFRIHDQRPDDPGGG